VSSRYGLEIRAPTTADLEGTAELLRSAGTAVLAGELGERLAAIRAGGGAVLIAVAWGPPSGVVALHWYRDVAAAAPVAVITTLFVMADERRRGIGRLLVKAAAQAARVAGCGALELAGSAEVSAFCLATGFSEVGPRFARGLRRGASRHPAGSGQADG
jgi:GNAT superfamily N-acetyltransferase